MQPGRAVSRPECHAADSFLGNSVGAIEWPFGGRLRPRGPPLLAGFHLVWFPIPCNNSAPSGASLAPILREKRLGSG